jgi:RNase P subunit RPR2
MINDWNCRKCNKNIWKLYSDSERDICMPTLFRKCLGCGDIKEVVYEQVD